MAQGYEFAKNVRTPDKHDISGAYSLVLDYSKN